MVGMPLSDAERARWSRLVEALEEAETDDTGTSEFRARVRAWANEERAARGISALKDEWQDPPEEEFYRRARTLGMVRSRR